MANNVVHIIASGVLGGLLVLALNLLLEKRGRRKAQRMNESADAAMERISALSERAEAALQANAEFAELLRRKDERISRKMSCEVVTANLSTLLSSYSIFEIRLQSRDLEETRSAYADFEDSWETSQPGYATARARARSSADPEHVLAAVDAAESAANTLHTMVADWYGELEAAGWPAAPPQPAGLPSARAACFGASRELSRVSVEGLS